MTQPYASLPIPGSRRHVLAGARRVGDVAPDETVFVTVVLRRGAEEPGGPADQGDVDAIWAFASRFGLEVVSVSLAARSVRLRGTVADMTSAFGVSLALFGTDEFSYRGRVDSIYVPENLDGVVVAVL